MSLSFLREGINREIDLPICAIFHFRIILELGRYIGFSQDLSQSSTHTLYFLSCKDRGELFSAVVTAGIVQVRKVGIAQADMIQLEKEEGGNTVS